MKTAVIIQARMGASRLPGKVLMKLAGKPVVLQVYERARMIRGVDDVVVATTVSPKDDELAEYCRGQGLAVFRGSEQDVLDRYVQAARQVRAEAVIRITADCPYLDPGISGQVLEAFLAEPGADYISNGRPPCLPDGLDTEVISSRALECAWREARDTPSREHVTLYVADHPEQFKAVKFLWTPDLSVHRWTLDQEEDYRMLSAVADELKRRGQFGWMHEVLAILADHPDIAALNQHIERNEGLKKSLEAWARTGGRAAAS